MVTRKRKKKSAAPRSVVHSRTCICGTCDKSQPKLRGLILAALGLVFLPISFGFYPEFEWLAKGWPILLVMIGIVYIAKESFCRLK